MRLALGFFSNDAKMTSGKSLGLVKAGSQSKIPLKMCCFYSRIRRVGFAKSSLGFNYIETGIVARDDKRDTTRDIGGHYE